MGVYRRRPLVGRLAGLWEDGIMEKVITEAMLTADGFIPEDELLLRWNMSRAELRKMLDDGLPFKQTTHRQRNGKIAFRRFYHVRTCELWYRGAIKL